MIIFHYIYTYNFGLGRHPDRGIDLASARSLVVLAALKRGEEMMGPLGRTYWRFDLDMYEYDIDAGMHLYELYIYDVIY